MKTISMRHITALLAACGAAVLVFAACSHDPKLDSANNNPAASDPNPGSPEAQVLGEQLMRSMSDTLARSKAFTFETNERLEVAGAGGDKRTVLLSRKVIVRRPNALFFELSAKGDAAIEVAAYYNGKTLALTEKTDGAWAQTTVPGTLDHMLDDVAVRYGLPVPIGDVVYSSPYDAFIGSSTKGGFAGRETIEGVPCAKLDYADDTVHVKLWVAASGQALPRRVEILYKKAPTPIVTQINFSNWKLDATVTDAMFTFQPPSGSKPAEFGAFVSKVVSRLVPPVQTPSPTVSGGTPAPSPTRSRL